MPVASPQPQAPAPPKHDFNTDYLRSPPAILRIAKGVLAIVALICTAEGYCALDGGRYAFSLFVFIVSIIEAVLILAVFVLRLDTKLPGIDFTLSLLLNDGISLILYFIVTTLALLSIGRCESGVAARVFSGLFTISLFLILVGLNYINYMKWNERQTQKDIEALKTSGMTVTNSSPTVLT